MLIPGYKKGSNITIMNAFYKGVSRQDNGKWKQDYLTIVYKDNETGEKHQYTEPNPEYSYYVAKDDVTEIEDYPIHFIDKSKVREVTTLYKDLLHSIAKETNNLELYEENKKYGNFKANQLLLLNPRVFSADIPILSYIRAKFNEEYKNPVIPISIAFFDIESDIINADSDDIVIGRDPVNMISMYFTGTKTMYNFVLRNPRNPQIEILENNMKNDFAKYKKKFTDFIEFDLGGMDKVQKYGLDDIKLSVGFYDTEIDLIYNFFTMMNILKPDFATAYNMAYDMRQLMARIEALGADPRAIICDLENFDEKWLFYEYFHEGDKPEIEERCDRLDISCMTTYIDQMVIYASRRKGQKAIESYALDHVGTEECGVRKLDYHDITTNIAKFPYLDFERFWLYNMIDVIVQVCLEAQTSDIKYVFNNVIEMNTPYQKIFRQTVYLAAKAADFYKNVEGVILGNNTNKFGKKPLEKFPGAFVANPNLISDRNKVEARGRKIPKFNNGNDFDYKRLYPSLLQYFNMAPHTQVGMVTIPDSPHQDDPQIMLKPGGTFVENLASYNYIEFCKRWMNLANIEECMQDMKEYFSTYRTPMYLYDGTPKLPYDTQRKVIAYIEDRSRPVVFDAPMPDWVKAEVNKIREDIYRAIG